MVEAKMSKVELDLPVLRRHDDISATHRRAAQRGAVAIRGPSYNEDNNGISCTRSSELDDSSSEEDSMAPTLPPKPPSPQQQPATATATTAPAAAATLRAVPVDEEAEAERDRMLEVYRNRCAEQERRLQEIQRGEAVHVITPLSVTVVDLDEATAESSANQIRTAVKTFCCKTQCRIRIVGSVALAVLLVIVAVGVILGTRPGGSSAPGETFSKCFKSTDDLRQAVKEFLSGEATDLNETLGSIDTWCVSEIEDFSFLFSADENLNAASFNEDISSWDLSSATSTRGMFLNAAEFNQSLSNWNVSQVGDMREMFQGCSSFNQDLSSWNVSKVTKMHRMFKDAASFNGNVSSWNVAQVVDMWSMFDGAASFNRDVSSWDVSNVETTTCMFHEATSFNQDLSEWVVTNVFSMHAMFQGAIVFDSEVSGWSVSGVVDMSRMFEKAASFNRNISRWDVSNIDNMQFMFSDATRFDQDISSWQVSQVIDMQYLFQGATSFNQNISSWDVSRVESMQNMFNGATAFNQSLCQWGRLLSSEVDTKRMFLGTTCPNNEGPHFNATPPGPFCHPCD